MRYGPGKCNPLQVARLLQLFFNLSPQTAIADEQEVKVRILGRECNSVSQCKHTMPWAKSTDKSHNLFCLSNSQFIACNIAAYIGTKFVRIHSVWVNDDLFRGH